MTCSTAYLCWWRNNIRPKDDAKIIPDFVQVFFELAYRNSKNQIIDPSKFEQPVMLLTNCKDLIDINNSLPFAFWVFALVKAQNNKFKILDIFGNYFTKVTEILSNRNCEELKFKKSRLSSKSSKKKDEESKTSENSKMIENEENYWKKNMARIYRSWNFIETIFLACEILVSLGKNSSQKAKDLQPNWFTVHKHKYWNDWGSELSNTIEFSLTNDWTEWAFTNSNMVIPVDIQDDISMTINSYYMSSTEEIIIPVEAYNLVTNTEK